jgi:hypothetical protein
VERPVVPTWFNLTGLGVVLWIAATAELGPTESGWFTPRQLPGVVLAALGITWGAFSFVRPPRDDDDEADDERDEE